MIKKGRMAGILGMLLVLVLLAGCAKGTAHMTIQKDGSVDLGVNLRLDSRTQSLVNGTVEQMLTDKLKESGIQLQKVQDGSDVEYQFVKSYSSFQDMKSQSSGIQVVDAKVSTDANWLYTKYDVQALPKLNNYVNELIDSAGTLSVPGPLVRMFMQSFAFDFQLTLPIDLYGPNNATSQDGRTLTWHMTLGDTEPLKLVVYVPNIKNIVITVVLVLLIVAGGIIWFIRKRSGKRKAA